MGLDRAYERSKIGLSDGEGWPLIGLATAVCRQFATLMASSFPEDDHRFLTHSIKASMEAVSVAMLRLTYHMIETKRDKRKTSFAL